MKRFKIIVINIHNMDNILCISAHPDDIELGMGGSISRFVEEGKIVNIIICFYHQEDRKQETYNALKLLGIQKDNIYFLNKTHNNRDLIKQLDQIVFKIKPNNIFTHFNGDSHQEHKIVTDISIASTRNIECNIFMWENTFPGAITYNFFKPNFYIKLNNNYIQKKINSFCQHKSQTKKYNTTKITNFINIKSQFWGNYCNHTHAESFIQIKSVY